MQISHFIGLFGVSADGLALSFVSLRVCQPPVLLATWKPWASMKLFARLKHLGQGQLTMFLEERLEIFATGSKVLISQY